MEVYLQSIAMFRFIKLVRWSAFMLKSYRYFEFHFPQTNIFPSAIGALRCILYPRNDQRSRNLLHSSIQPVYLSKIGTVLPQFDQIWSPKPDPLWSSNNKSIPVTQIKLKTIPELARFSYQTESSIILLKSAQLFASLQLNHINRSSDDCTSFLKCKDVLVTQVSSSPVTQVNASARVARCNIRVTIRREKREREPSRIPKRKLFHILKQRQKRKKIKLNFKNSFPRSSRIHFFCKTFTLWSPRYFYECHFTRYWFPTKPNLRKSTFRNKCFVNCIKTSDSNNYSTIQIFRSLSGGMNPTDSQSSDIDASYSRMTCRLFDKGLQALDCRSSGDCFFKSISHQYYGTPEFHHLIRQAGVHYLEQHPELFIETLTDGSWTTYLKRMAAPGTWCDNNIIQAVANQLNCVIHIIESRISNPEGTTIIYSTILSCKYKGIVCWL